MRRRRSSIGLPRVGQWCAWSGLFHWIGIAKTPTEVGAAVGGHQATNGSSLNRICLTNPAFEGTFKALQQRGDIHEAFGA
jgi:hypothetical protein